MSMMEIHLELVSIIDSFESQDLNLQSPPYSNLPLLTKSEKKLFQVSRDNNNGADGIETLKNSIANKTKKSFLCLAKLLTC